MNIPVLFVFFVKDTAKKVFEAVKRNKPPKLYLASDGPREGRSDDAKRISDLRGYVLKNIDWPCEVKTFFREKNVGCRINVSSAVSWFFENEEMGMIIEDDVLPLDSAFLYCEELLIRFKEEKKIGSIACFNPISYKTKNSKYSYFFSRYSIIWGWATWRDRWLKYDVKMRGWLSWKKSKEFERIYKRDLKVKLYWEKLLDFIYFYDDTVWDPQWTFTHLENNWLTVIPAKNLIFNLGFDSPDAVNCNEKAPMFVQKSIPEELKFPLIYNNGFSVSEEIENFIEKDYYGMNWFKIIGYYFKDFAEKIPLLKRLHIYRKFKSIYYKIFN